MALREKIPYRNHARRHLPGGSDPLAASRFNEGVVYAFSTGSGTTTRFSDSSISVPDLTQTLMTPSHKAFDSLFDSTASYSSGTVTITPSAARDTELWQFGGYVGISVPVASRISWPVTPATFEVFGGAGTSFDSTTINNKFELSFTPPAGGHAGSFLGSSAATITSNSVVAFPFQGAVLWTDPSASNPLFVGTIKLMINAGVSVDATETLLWAYRVG